MLMITCDIIISKETGILLLMILIYIYKTLSARIKSDKSDKVTLKLMDNRLYNVILGYWMEK